VSEYRDFEHVTHREFEMIPVADLRADIEFKKTLPASSGTMTGHARPSSGAMSVVWRERRHRGRRHSGKGRLQITVPVSGPVWLEQ
jgi:hypothetical protein